MADLKLEQNFQGAPVMAEAAPAMADKRAATLRAERRIVEAVSKVYEQWGFEPLDTGAF